MPTERDSQDLLRSMESARNQSIAVLMNLAPKLAQHIASLAPDLQTLARETVYAFVTSSDAGDFIREGAQIDILTALPLDEIIAMPDVHKVIPRESYETKGSHRFRVGLLKTLSVLPISQRRALPASPSLSIELSPAYVCSDMEGYMCDALEEDAGMVVTFQGRVLGIAKVKGRITLVALEDAEVSDGKKLLAGGIYTLDPGFKEVAFRDAFIRGDRTVELEGKLFFARLEEGQYRPKGASSLREACYQYGLSSSSRGARPKFLFGRADYFDTRGYTNEIGVAG